MTDSSHVDWQPVTIIVVKRRCDLQVLHEHGSNQASATADDSERKTSGPGRHRHAHNPW